MKTKFTKRMKDLKFLVSITVAIIYLLLVPRMSIAQVVVIPLFGDDIKPLKNIITVAKQNGDFTDPIAAVNSITDASGSNQYLVVIAPGTYHLTSTLVMKEYVDVAGSGQNITWLKSAAPLNGNMVYFHVKNARLSDLFISASNLSSTQVIDFAGNANPTSHLNNVIVKAYAATGSSFSAINLTRSSPVLTDVTVLAYGGANAHGIQNIQGSPVINGGLIRAIAGSSSSKAIWSSRSPVITLNDVKVYAEGSVDVYGIKSVDSKVVLRDIEVEVVASSGNPSITGIHNSSTSFSTIWSYLDLDGAKILSRESSNTAGIVLGDISGSNRPFPDFGRYYSTIRNATVSTTGGGSPGHVFTRIGITNSSHREIQIIDSTIFNTGSTSFRRGMGLMGVFTGASSTSQISLSWVGNVYGYTGSNLFLNNSYLASTHDYDLYDPSMSCIHVASSYYTVDSDCFD